MKRSVHNTKHKKGLAFAKEKGSEPGTTTFSPYGETTRFANSTTQQFLWGVLSVGSGKANWRQRSFPCEFCNSSSFSCHAHVWHLCIYFPSSTSTHYVFLVRLLSFEGGNYSSLGLVLKHLISIEHKVDFTLGIALSAKLEQSQSKPFVAHLASLPLPSSPRHSICIWFLVPWTQSLRQLLP